ncbi:MAG: hypothetical protein M1822_009037 [Bathelium mastoideum]|nr:MAG: hypothetical protein M1822_009037 [Bathelium mastoideum]
MAEALSTETSEIDDEPQVQISSTTRPISILRFKKEQGRKYYLVKWNHAQVVGSLQMLGDHVSSSKNFRPISCINGTQFKARLENGNIEGHMTYIIEREDSWLSESSLAQEGALVTDFWTKKYRTKDNLTVGSNGKEEEIPFDGGDFTRDPKVILL